MRESEGSSFSFLISEQLTFSDNCFIENMFGSGGTLSLVITID